MVIKQRSGAIIRHHHNTSSSRALEVYKLQAQSGALYEAELWGNSDCHQMVVAENYFLKSLLKLPTSTPTIPLLWDLNIKCIGLILKLRPLLYWVRVWTTPELEIYISCLHDCMRTDVNHKIPWLSHIKKWLMMLGWESYWTSPLSMPKNSAMQIKRLFWESYVLQVCGDPTQRPLDF